METSSNPKNYSFIRERDQPTTRGENILHYASIVSLIVYGVATLFKAYKEGSYDFVTLIGACIIITGLISLAGFFIQNRKFKKSVFYLTIDQGILRYRWGSFQKEKQANLDQLNYTTSSPNEIILRFVDRSEIIIDNKLLTGHATKYDELKKVLLSYHQKKQPNTL